LSQAANVRDDDCRHMPQSMAIATESAANA
jgi:hypothetical protein